MREFLQHKEHSSKNKNGSDDIEDGDLFIKNQPGKDGGNHRIKVHIIRCYDSSQPLYCPIPGNKTEHGCHTT